MNGESSTLKRPKKLIVCCDGTWINSDVGQLENNGTFLHPKWEVQDPSNVTRIGRAIPSSDSQHRPQIVYYQAGVGTSPSKVENLVGGGTGRGLSENVREAYGFLANNYEDGDSVYLMGFSRGAFTARSIVAQIDAVGLLTKRAMKHFYRVFEDFQSAGEKGASASITKEVPDFHIEVPSTSESMIERRKEYLAEYLKELKRLNKTQEIPIKAIGVWDTVGALGIPTTGLLQSLGLPAFLNDQILAANPYRFTDTLIGKKVDYAFQALALDERRTSFGPTVWEQPDNENDKNNNSDQSRTVLKQVWFPGGHSDVGGSEADTGLADLSLAWMMSELEAAGLEFDDTYLADQWRQNRWEYAERAAESRAGAGGLLLLHHYNPIALAKSTFLRLLNLPFALLSSADARQHSTADDDNGNNNDAPVDLGNDNTVPHWALTRLHDSAANPTALGGLANRTPRAYHRTNYATGQPMPSAPLRGTRERVHASVRVRLQVRGRSYEGRGVYNAEALRGNGWMLEQTGGGGDEGQGERRWRWVNRSGGAEVRGAVLDEDELGRLEVLLLREDPEMAAWVLGEGEARARTVDPLAASSLSSSSSS